MHVFHTKQGPHCVVTHACTGAANAKEEGGAAGETEFMDTLHTFTFFVLYTATARVAVWSLWSSVATRTSSSKPIFPE